MTLLIELIFALVFLSALFPWIRRRDPLLREVTLVFSGLATLFVLELARRLMGEPPELLGRLGAALLLAQAYFTLRLAAALWPVPRWLPPAALVAYLVTSLPFVLLGDLTPRPLLLAAVVVFVLTELVAAAFLLAKARSRTGSPRFRLGAAAAASILFGVAILAAGVTSGQAEAVQEVGGNAARMAGLLAAVLYLIAFVPPRWLSRLWQSTAGYSYGQQLARIPASEEPAAIWDRFAHIAQTISGAEAVGIVGTADDGSAAVLGSVGLRAGAGATFGRQDLERLVADARETFEKPPTQGGPIAAALAGPVEARYFSVVPVPTDEGLPLAVVLLSGVRSLFRADDRGLLEELGAQAARLADRSRVLDRQERLAAELASTVRALEGASRAKSDFLASMSHELRTPLSAIIGFSDLMLAEPRDGDRMAVQAEWVEHIHRSGEHLLGLINDVLDLTKVEAGRLELHREDFDIAHAVRESLSGMRPLADRKGIRLRSLAEPARVVADRGRVRQILYNLISNAIKFTPDGGEVRVECEAGGEELRVSVIDTGVGIAPEDQARVFEEFSQVGDAERRQGGTGLGLALTRRLIEAHGGRIELESRPGAGSRFTVVLPRESDPIAARQDAPPSAPTRTAGGDVLVIEDDPGAVGLLRTYLEEEGYRVRVRADGESGLAAAHEATPAAILLDLLLPGIDGWEVLRELKADARLRDVPVIIVTVLDEREVGLALGAVDYFLKPVDRDALLERLARFTFTTKVREGTVRVLAVDDDPAALQLIEGALRPEGFEVITASSGSEGIELARAVEVDLVILDLLMPGLDGFEVVAALRGDPATEQLPILVLTAKDLTEAEKQRLNGDILGVVSKGEAGTGGLRAWLRRVAPRAEALAPDARGMTSTA
ncbi:MAG TPA: response regulator [Candidatus Limnocylindrales bacterium]|nr:response regulator [Candidatus Limnocylindrales bacterium]